MQVWVDGWKQYQASGGALNTSLALSSGTHRVAVVAQDTTGLSYKQTIYISTGTQNPACSAQSGVVICSPVDGATVSSALHVVAGANDAAGISNMQVWVDGVKQYQVSGRTLDTAIAVAPGARRLAVVAVDKNAATYKQTVYVNAQ